MQNDHYTAIVFITCFVMISFIVAVIFNPLINKKHKVRFSLLFLTLDFVNVFEWLAHLSLSPVATTIFKFIEFSLGPLVALFALRAIGGGKYVKVLYVLVTVNLVLEIVSIPTGIIFTIDGNGFARGPVYGIYIAILVLCFAGFVGSCITNSIRYQFRDIAFLLCIIAVVVFGLISQLIFSSLNLDWICVSFASVMIYIYYSELVHQVDPLTGLLNRNGFESHLQKMKQPVWIIFFDVDRFKSINDVYGHIYGDECLKLIAENVQEFFGEYGYCFRYGGDEFCAILARDDLDLRTLIIAYENKLADLRKKDDRLPGISAGFTRFDPAVEAYDEAISRADGNMYDEKLKHHQAMDEEAKKSSEEEK